MRGIILLSIVKEISSRLTHGSRVVVVGGGAHPVAASIPQQRIWQEDPMAFVRSPKNWPGGVIEEDVWLAWGKLVEKWVKDPSSRPGTLTDFQRQLADNNVPMKLPEYLKNVEFLSYKQDVLYIPLPSKEMITEGERWMEEIAERGHGKGKYPLPSFYELAFSGDQVDLTLDELMDFNRRRIGEYTINLCG
jgi:hypothetical protein